MPRKWEHGWLTNKERAERREMAQTLTDSQVLELVQKIDSITEYTKLSEEADKLMKLRDKALIAANWIWFKRGNEILHLRFGDITITEKELMVSLLIEKKNKTYRICPSCKEKNSRKASYCKKCGSNISTVELEQTGTKSSRKTKTKSIDFPFCKYVVEWYRKMEEMEAKPTAWMFPRYHYFSRAFLFYGDKPFTIQRYNQILQRLDYTMTSSMFRYGGAEKYLRLGYTPYELKEIGDWSSSKMPEIYADKKGLTPSQKKFSEDNRTI